MNDTEAARARLERAAPWILIGWVVLNYGWTAWFGFVNDDFIWVAGARPHPGGSWVRTAFVSPFFSQYFVRPLVQLSFAMNYRAGGLAPFGYHAVNVLLQAANAYLVWRLARRLLADAAAAVLVALLFAAHPAHPDAVTWVSGRTELVAVAFYLAALLLHVEQRFGCAAGLFGLALLSKESAITFPLMALAVDWCAASGNRWRPRSTAIYGTALVAYVVLRVLVTDSSVVGQAGVSLVQQGNVGALVRFLSRRWTQAAWYLLLPLPGSAWMARGVLLVLVLACFWAVRDCRRRVVGLASIWVLIALVPFVGLWAFQARYVYLATVGWALLLVSAMQALGIDAFRKRSHRFIAGGCATAWLVASVVSVQLQNDQLRRNGLMSARVLDAVVAAVPQPAHGALLEIGGLGPLRMGYTEGLRSPVFVSGLTDALRLRFADPTLEVTFVETATMAPGQGRWAIQLEWNTQTETFIRRAGDEHG